MVKVILSFMALSEGRKKTPWLRVIFSTLAAAFGVQSQKNLEADEKEGKIMPFIITGIIFTAIFVLSLVWLVSNIVPK